MALGRENEYCRSGSLRDIRVMVQHLNAHITSSAQEAAAISMGEKASESMSSNPVDPSSFLDSSETQLNVSLVSRVQHGFDLNQLPPESEQ